MKKDSPSKDNNLILFMAGVLASIMMIAIALFFVRGVLTGNIIKTINPSVSISDLKQKLDNNFVNDNKKESQAIILNNTYICLDSNKKPFRSNEPCLKQD